RGAAAVRGPADPPRAGGRRLRDRPRQLRLHPARPEPRPAPGSLGGDPGPDRHRRVNVEERSWFSEALGQDMGLKVYGHAGRPVVAFPSQDGRYWDFESWGMVDACSAFIVEGRARIIAVDGIDWQSWTNQSISPADRGRRHDEYDRYLADELVPFVRDLSGWERAWATGASMGGYHAANVTFRHPDLFDGLIALSGLYQLGLFVGDDGSEPV